MFIQSLTIKNYRSIKELNLEPKNLCALIGPNSSGKTNILKALDLVIGEGWTTKAKEAVAIIFDQFHFKTDTNNEWVGLGFVVVPTQDIKFADNEVIDFK